MVILTKECKPDNFESHNFLIRGLRSNFVDCGSFVESKTQTWMTQLIMAISLWGVIFLYSERILVLIRMISQFIWRKDWKLLCWKVYAENFSKNSYRCDSGISLPVTCFFMVSNNAFWVVLLESANVHLQRCFIQEFPLRYRYHTLISFLENLSSWIAFRILQKAFKPPLLGLRQFVTIESPINWFCRKNDYVEKLLDKKVMVNFRILTSQTGQQMTTIHVLRNISGSKGNQAMRFEQLIRCSMRNIFFFKNHAENVVGRIAPDLLLFLEKLYLR